MDLTAQQREILERLRSHGIDVISFPRYANLVGVRKGNCAALLAPSGADGFSIQGEPTYVVGGDLSARVVRSDGQYFVRKQEHLKATPERLAELDRFTAELAEALLPVA